MAVAATEAAWTEGDGGWPPSASASTPTGACSAEMLADRLPGVGYLVPDATYLAWLDCRELGLGDDPAESSAAAASS